MARNLKTAGGLELREKRVANLTNAGKGRVKGVPNKSTIAVKQALIDAFEKMGGVNRLVEFAHEQPGEFYKLWVKVMPQEISGVDGGDIQTKITVEFVGKPS